MKMSCLNMDEREISAGLYCSAILKYHLSSSFCFCFWFFSFSKSEKYTQIFYDDSDLAEVYAGKAVALHINEAF